MTNPTPRPETIDKLGTAVYPSFAMLAGMQLEVFTPLGDGAMSAEQLATALSVGPAKLRPLLYALVATGLLTVDGDLFSNTPEADHFLVRGKPAYQGGRHELFSARWAEVLKPPNRFVQGWHRPSWSSRRCRRMISNRSFVTYTRPPSHQGET